MKDVLELTTGGFNWDSIRFKNQYFKKEDFLTFANNKAPLKTPEIHDERVSVQNKLLQLHESIKNQLSRWKLYEDYASQNITNSLDPLDYPDHKIPALWLAYGRSKTELLSYHPDARFSDFIRMVILVTQKEVALWLIPGQENAGKLDREYFGQKMHEPEYRKIFFQLLIGLNPDTVNSATPLKGYWIQIAGEKKPVYTFQNEDSLWEFTKYDEWKHYGFQIGKNFLPGDPEISNEHIASTISREFDKLILLYRHIKHSAEPCATSKDKDSL